MLALTIVDQYPGACAISHRRCMVELGTENLQGSLAQRRQKMANAAETQKYWILQAMLWLVIKYFAGGKEGA
jgi:hypothetical protein